MAKLIIKRKKELLAWSNVFQIIVDGDKIGTVANGDIVSLDIREGEHRLKLEMDWRSSRYYQFSVGANESHAVLATTYPFSLTTFVIKLIFLFGYFFFRRVFGYPYVWFFIAPFVIYTLYFVSIGRNKYIRIKEDQLSLSF
jgi:hypothetical protein